MLQWMRRESAINGQLRRRRWAYAFLKKPPSAKLSRVSLAAPQQSLAPLKFSSSNALGRAQSLCQVVFRNSCYV